MKKEPVFYPIDRAAWAMGQQFYYYTEMAPTSYTITVHLDVTVMRRTLKEAGCKFFPGYLYAVTRAISTQQAMRISVQKGVLGYWDFLTPAYPQFHEDDKTTTLLWTEYDGSFQEFYTGYSADRAKYGNSHGILSAKGIPLPNAYIISCIPWFTFTSFSLHNHGIKDYFVPSFEAGAFVEKEGRSIMPLSVTVHHATTDGYHLKVFFDELGKIMNNPAEWVFC